MEIVGVSKLPVCGNCGSSADFRTYGPWGVDSKWFCNSCLPEEGRKIYDQQTKKNNTTGHGPLV